MSSFTTLFTIGMFGLLLMCVILNRLSSLQNATWLSKHGARITARVTEVKRRLNLENKYQMIGYVVIAQWKDPQTQQVYTYESDPRPSYPKQYCPGSAISVLIDPAHPQRYHMELPKREE